MCTGETKEGTPAEGPNRGGIPNRELSKGGASRKDKPSEGDTVSLLAKMTDEVKSSEGTGKAALSGGVALPEGGTLSEETRGASTDE